jgi:hypothetical protein
MLKATRVHYSPYAVSCRGFAGSKTPSLTGTLLLHNRFVKHLEFSPYEAWALYRLRTHTTAPALRLRVPKKDTE